MDWTKSYSCQWRVFRVNRDTWADAEQINDVDAVSITKTADGDLLESASMDVTGDLTTDYYRVVMTAIQDDDVERVDVATLLFEVNGGEFDYGTTAQNADGFSVLFPASKKTIVTGAYAPAGVDGARYAGDLLKSAINAPVEVNGSFSLNENVVHEIGTSVLEAAWSVLEAGGFIIQISGRGVVSILPKPTEPALIMDSGNTRLLSHGISYTRDISEIPNRYICIEGDFKAVATNDDPASIISTISRGFYIDELDEAPTLINGETLTGYADRRLHELSVLQEEYSYTREYSPGVNLYSIVRASIDGLEGDMRVTDQTLTCGNGITVEEKVNREEALW